MPLENCVFCGFPFLFFLSGSGRSRMPIPKTALMAGVDTMSRGELVIACEKHGIDGGKTVSTMKYALKKYYEDHGDDSDDDAPPKKKGKADTSAAAKPGHCALGAACPDLYSLTHRMALQHDGFRGNPIKCREGMGCPKLKDKEHLVKYAHDDDLAKVCPDGGNCSQLHLMDHRREYEHPGYRIQPVACRDGMTCAKLHDKGHLYKYAHEGKASDEPAPASDPAPLAEPPAAKKAEKAAKKPKTPPPEADDDEAAAPPAKLTKEASVKKAPVVKGPAKTAVAGGKTLDDVPLASAPESILVPVEKDSEEFWELEEKFAANLQGRNEDYVEKRIKAGKKPLRFILIGAEKVVNPVLEARFEIMKAQLLATRDPKDCRERVSFHGTHPKNLKSILHYSLLRFQHPLNPCKTQVDDGYFGTNKKGIYVSRYADYTLKYSNRVCAVDEGDEVKTIMFRTLPGKSKHIPKLVGAIDPTAGYDSHSSPTFLEWYLFNEAQVCPQYVLKIKTVLDTRTAADDE